MERNDDILKYLSDMMTEIEKTDFENRLLQSEDLKNAFEKYKNTLSELNSISDIKADSPYFQNLLPRVRSRMSKKTGIRWIPKLAYLIPTATAIVLIFINIGRFTPEQVQIKKDAAVENKSTEKSDMQELYNDYNMVSGSDMLETDKKAAISFEVGVSDVANKESMKEILKTRIAYPVEDYLLALK